MNGFDRTLHAQIASSSRVIDVLPIIVPAYRFNCKAPVSAPRRQLSCTRTSMVWCANIFRG